MNVVLNSQQASYVQNNGYVDAPMSPSLSALETDDLYNSPAMQAMQELIKLQELQGHQPPPPVLQHPIQRFPPQEVIQQLYCFHFWLVGLNCFSIMKKNDKPKKCYD
jgi:hypothetical protein